MGAQANLPAQDEQVNRYSWVVINNNISHQD